MDIVGVIYGRLNVLLVVKIAASAKTVVKIIRSTKSDRWVISKMLKKDAAENLSLKIGVDRILCNYISGYRDNNVD